MHASFSIFDLFLLFSSTTLTRSLADRALQPLNTNPFRPFQIHDRYSHYYQRGPKTKSNYFQTVVRRWPMTRITSKAVFDCDPFSSKRANEASNTAILSSGTLSPKRVNDASSKAMVSSGSLSPKRLFCSRRTRTTGTPTGASAAASLI